MLKFPPFLGIELRGSLSRNDTSFKLSFIAFHFLFDYRVRIQSLRNFWCGYLRKKYFLLKTCGYSREYTYLCMYEVLHRRVDTCSDVS